MDNEHADIVDLIIKGNVNGNHMEQQRKKLPRENQQFEDKDRVFGGQNSLLGNMTRSSKIKTRYFCANKAKISNKTREEKS